MPRRKPFSLKTILLVSRILLRYLKSSKIFPRSSHVSTRHHTYSSLPHRTHLQDHALIFNVEDTLLRSSSLFPYFMLVAFEAGSPLRSLLLLLLYPLISMLGRRTAFKIMVFVSFFGINKNTFRVGSAVLPKFFLEDVGLESYEVLRTARTKVAVTDLPLVMVESFLRDYLGIEHVVGRELKVFCGYFVGLLMEHEQEDKYEHILALDMGKIGICGFQTFPDLHGLFSHCKEIYLVGREEKKKWRQLAREKYPKQLIFHDGRLALRPTPLAALAMFMWVPFGLVLVIVRTIICISLPYEISTPILAFCGMRLRVTKPKTRKSSTCKTKTKGVLYVCNHRTLLDPLYLCVALGKNLTAVTYSLSIISEIIAPIRTVRLTRNRDRDGKMMERLLDLGDLVVCPEGTTCREPYLLRFSPLFAEMSENIVPVAMDTRVEMFHGTTASGLKGLDPVLFLMNPTPSYTVKLLDPVSTSTCRDGDERWKFDVANQVQRQLGQALGFECTKLTRRDKYLILAGNEGITNSSTNAS